jgi:hypothetical protein
MATNLTRIGEKARKEPKLVFTSLYHHICDVDNLRACYDALDARKATGVDGVTSRPVTVWSGICDITPSRIIQRGAASIWKSHEEFSSNGSTARANDTASPGTNMLGRWPGMDGPPLRSTTTSIPVVEADHRMVSRGAVCMGNPLVRF